jgi:hypothetical protein
MTGLELFTAIHVLISLVGIVSGFVAVFGMVRSKPLDWWTDLFLFTTVATSVTGFLFPFRGFTPAIGTGIISMIVLALAVVALRVKHLDGPWRRTYVISAVAAQYFNFFVLIVQSFRRVPFLNALAPTETEAPFAVAQLLALVGFVVLGYAAARGFVRAAPRPAILHGSHT